MVMPGGCSSSWEAQRFPQHGGEVFQVSKYKFMREIIFEVLFNLVRADAFENVFLPYYNFFVYFLAG
jgi:hypothetical protein